MENFLKLLFIAFVFLNIAAVNPKDLVKVTKDTEQSCVEYYNYQGAMYCSTKALSVPTDVADIKNEERQTIVFDNRPWQVAWGKKTDKMTTIEYVPMGEDINSWHELVTTQFFPSIQDKVSPKEFANTIVKSLKDSGFKPKITYHSETPNSVIFEFQIDSPKNQVQNELQKVTKGKDGIYILHYVIKKNDMGAGDRSKWVKNLLASKIKN